jgi:hypothetical protein
VPGVKARAPVLAKDGAVAERVPRALVDSEGERAPVEPAAAVGARLDLARVPAGEVAPEQAERRVGAGEPEPKQGLQALGEEQGRV